jgi:hypothetical protein
MKINPLSPFFMDYMDDFAYNFLIFFEEFVFLWAY